MASEDKTPVEDFGELAQRLREMEGHAPDRQRLTMPIDALEHVPGPSAQRTLESGGASGVILSVRDALHQQSQAAGQAEPPPPTGGGRSRAPNPTLAFGAEVAEAVERAAAQARPRTPDSRSRSTGPVKPAFGVEAEREAAPRRGQARVASSSRPRPKPPAPDTASEGARRRATVEIGGPLTQEKLRQLRESAPGPPGLIVSPEAYQIPQDDSAPRPAAAATTGPRVRAGRMTHVGSHTVGPRVVVHPVPDTGPERVVVDVRRTERVAAGVTLIVLFQAMALPIGHGDTVLPPWRELLHPDSAAFMAGSAFLLLLALTASRARPRVRSVLGLVLGVGLVLSALAHVASGLATGAFDGQPALGALLGPGASPRVPLVLAAVVLPAGLFWRRLSRRSPGPRMVIGLGLLLVGVVYVGLQLFGAPDAPARGLLVAARESPFRGDRLAAAAAWLPLVVMLLALPSLVSSSRGTRPTMAAFAFIAAALAPVLILALHVSSLDGWWLVLEPLQLTLCLAAACVWLPWSLAYALHAWIGVGARLSPRRRPGPAR